MNKLGYHELVQYAPFFVIIMIIISFSFLYNYLQESDRDRKDWKEKW